MDPTTSDITLAIFMVSIAAALLLWFERGEAANTVTRMMRMMTRAGLDTRIVTQGTARAKAIMKEARTRCGRCNSEDRCELWLEGEVEGENIFCPNARIFQDDGFRNRPLPAPFPVARGERSTALPAPRRPAGRPASHPRKAGSSKGARRFHRPSANSRHPSGERLAPPPRLLRYP